MLTINGRVRLWRRRWYSPAEGTTTPLDAWLDTLEGTISLGVREMACRLNGDGKNFDKAAANLARTAQVALSGEALRTLVEAEGQRVLQAQRSGRLPLDWSAADCQIEGRATTRIYVGSDGVMVPLVTDAEKTTRREKIKEKRRRRGRCRRGSRAPTSGTRSSRSSPSTTRSRSIGWSRARGVTARSPGG